MTHPIALVVDDDSLVLSAILRMLALDGYTVRPFHRGEQALSMMSSLRPDVILSDFDLGVAGESNGVDLLQVAARLVPSAGRILMSGRPPEGMSEKETWPACVDAFLRKPFTAVELRTVVRSCIGIRHQPTDGRDRSAHNGE